MIVSCDGSSDRMWSFDIQAVLRWAAEAVRYIVRRWIAFSIEPHRAIVVVSVIRALRFVDRQGIVVHTQTITVRIRIRNQSRLQHLVRRKTHARHNIAWFERGLLDFCKIILRIALQL